MQRLRQEHTYVCIHWLTWKPLEGQRRHHWMQGVWGKCTWSGCMASWETDQSIKCDLCHQHHHGMVHQQLIECPMWVGQFKVGLASLLE